MTHSAAGDAGTATDDGVVYDLDSRCTLKDVERGSRYLATVNGTVDYGVFVDLSKHVSGLVHESNLRGDPAVGDDLVVTLAEIREDSDVGFEAADVDPADVDTVAVLGGDEVGVGDLADRIGDVVHLEGDVVQIKQTAGPTVFSVRDGSGVVPCAAFEAAGVRAHADVELDDAVRVTGTVETRGDEIGRASCRERV